MLVVICASMVHYEKYRVSAENIDNYDNDTKVKSKIMLVELILYF